MGALGGGRRPADLVFRNHGVNGQRTDEIAARLDAQPQAPTCSSYRAASTTSPRAGRSSPRPRTCARMVRRGKELGLRVAIANLLPWNNGWPEWKGRSELLNRLIDELGGG